LHGGQLGRFWISHRDPDKATRPTDIKMNLIDGDVSELLTVLVSGAIDQQPINPSIQM
jgi:hypothetical protein